MQITLSGVEADTLHTLIAGEVTAALEAKIWEPLSRPTKYTPQCVNYRLSAAELAELRSALSDLNKSAVSPTKRRVLSAVGL